MLEDFLNAARTGNVARLKELLATDATLLNQSNANGQSAVMLAKYHRQGQAVEYLLSESPELTLHEAAAVGAMEVVRHVIRERGRLIDTHAKDGFTALALAAFFGNTEIAEFLINQGANLNLAADNPMRVAPLHAAVAGRHRAIVKLLVEAGADVNLRQQQGWTPLHAAAQNGDAETVTLLLSHGADRKARADNGQSALDLALTGGHGSVAGLLEG